MSWFKPKAQLKQDHRMQEEWERVIRQEQPQEERTSEELFRYRVIVVPTWRVDEKLIGKEYR
jgi:hypothetical protein